MNCHWKFWKRAQKEDHAPAQEAVQEQGTAWFGLMSSRELLGLQRVIGNQAVLELMKVQTRMSSVNEAPLDES